MTTKFNQIPLSEESKKQIQAFLIETGTNEEMRNENMATSSVEELVKVANKYGFNFSPSDMIRHQAETILTFTDKELVIYYRNSHWWQLCLEAYSLYGR